MPPHTYTVLHHICSAGSITQREALMDYSIQCLTNRIRNLYIWDLPVNPHVRMGLRTSRGL